MKRKVPLFYSETQMARLVRSPDARSATGLRDRAILAVLSASGLRASELCGLYPGDVRNGLMRVRRGKGGHERWVPISAKARDHVRRYLANHPARRHQRLFRTLEGAPISRRHLHKIVTRYSRSLGLRGGVHTVRHSCATRWLNRGISLESVRAMLGHVRIATTSIYLGTAVQALAREYRERLEAA